MLSGETAKGKYPHEAGEYCLEFSSEAMLTATKSP